VNDLERDLREVLRDDALRVPTPVSAPEGLRRSARRRQAAFGGAVVLAGLAVVAGIVAGATTLLSMENGPALAALGPKTTGTQNGITITYPQAWHLIDPDAAGLNGPQSTAESQMPRIVLALAPTQVPETFGCPGQIGGDAAATSLMTIQEEPLAVDGPAASPWPADLEPLAVDASESGCYPGWTFERAGWTSSGRTFEARIGFSPDVSNEEHDAMLAAFDSMTFEPPTAGAESVVLATGTAGGEKWRLIATKHVDGLSLSLDAESVGAGTGGYEPASDRLRLTSLVIGDDERAVRVVFGAVPAAAVRVRYGISGEGPDPGPPPEILDVPDEIDPRLNAFVFTIGEGQIATVEAYDQLGTVIASGDTESVNGPTETPIPKMSDDVLSDGRHFGYVRSVDPAARTIEFDLASFLSGNAADRAYQEATGDTGPVPNDHFVVNDNPMLRTITLAPDVRLRLLDWNRCCDAFFDGDLSLFAQAINTQSDVNDGDLIYRGQSQWWITVRDGVVTQIEEQYSP
jgi:hypothetical protein